MGLAFGNGLTKSDGCRSSCPKKDVLAEGSARITRETKIWVPGLDVIVPIDIASIPDFQRWVNFNGFHPGHRGYDFSAYINGRNQCIVGLPPDARVKAVADGIVTRVYSPRGSYASDITIEHGGDREGLRSVYDHVVPMAEEGRIVKKGDVIAALFKDPGNEEGRLVHLHLTLWNAWEVKPDRADPALIFPEIGELVAEPQDSDQFRFLQLANQPEIVIAHFKRLL